LLFFALLQCPEARFDYFIIAARAVVLAMLSQFVLGSVFIGIGGMLIWGFSAMAAAASRYYRHSQAANAKGT
jgi:hypothetical protein